MTGTIASHNSTYCDKSITAKFYSSLQLDVIPLVVRHQFLHNKNPLLQVNWEKPVRFGLLKRDGPDDVVQAPHKDAFCLVPDKPPRRSWNLWSLVSKTGLTLRFLTIDSQTNHHIWTQAPRLTWKSDTQSDIRNKWHCCHSHITVYTNPICSCVQIFFYFPNLSQDTSLYFTTLLQVITQIFSPVAHIFSAEPRWSITRRKYLSHSAMNKIHAYIVLSISIHTCTSVSISKYAISRWCGGRRHTMSTDGRYFRNCASLRFSFIYLFIILKVFPSLIRLMMEHFVFT